MSKRVLLVDDCVEILCGLKILFQKSCTLDVAGEAQSCAAALDLVRTTPVDAILLDLGLPDGHGLQILPQMKAQQPQAPVVVHSASEAVSDLLLSYKLGAHGYLVKGLDPPERVLATLHRVCNGEKVWTKDQLEQLERHAIDC